MTPLRITAIVEGDGEVAAVPVLVRRAANLMGWHGRVHIPPAIRQPASKLLRPGELERIVGLAARKLGGPGGMEWNGMEWDRLAWSDGPLDLHHGASAGFLT